MSVYGKMKSRTAPDPSEEYKRNLNRKEAIENIKLYLYNLEEHIKKHEVLLYWYSKLGEPIQEILIRDKKRKVIYGISSLLKFFIPYIYNLDFVIYNSSCSNSLTIYSEIGEIVIKETENRYILRIEIYYKNQKFAKRDPSKYRLEGLLRVKEIHLCYNNKKTIFKF